MVLTESIRDMNELARHGGFAPIQWVFANLTRELATHGGEDERAYEPLRAFALQS